MIMVLVETLVVVATEVVLVTLVGVIRYIGHWGRGGVKCRGEGSGVGLSLNIVVRRNSFTQNEY